MPLLAPFVGERKLLGYLLNVAAPSDVVYHLYSNIHTPVGADVLGSYTECVDGLYAPTVIPHAAWTIATAAGVTAATAPLISYPFGGAQTIDGYFVTDTTNTLLLWAEEFAGGPVHFAAGGGVMQLIPTVDLL